MVTAPAIVSPFSWLDGAIVVLSLIATLWIGVRVTGLLEATPELGAKRAAALGVRVVRSGDAIDLDGEHITQAAPPYELVNSLRASFLLTLANYRLPKVLV